MVPLVGVGDDSLPPTHVGHDVFGDQSALILRNFLNRQECQRYIGFSGKAGLTSCGYDASIRVVNRLEVASPAAAASLYRRLAPFCKTCIDLREEENKWPRGIQQNHERREYFPTNLNESLRFCRYEKGGFFLPHWGGGYHRNELERSMYTFMVYLNDNFEGGATRFYRDDQRHYVKGDPNKVVYTYQPRAGDAVLFHSQIVHDGALVTAGFKYILRTEVMYTARLPALKDKPKYAPDHGNFEDNDFVPDESCFNHDSDDDDFD